MLSALLKYATLLSLVAVPVVNAHGYVETVSSGSSSWPGYNPNTDPYYNPPRQLVVRKIPGNGPVENLSLIDVQCNGYTAGGAAGSAPAAAIATVAAGSTVNLKWTLWPDSHLGPTLTYLARVPDGQSITSWSPGTSKVWFKIAHDGKNSNNQWATATRLNANGGVYSVKIPSSLKPGQYLLRHEIIALHAAWQYPGAQVYPVCVQLQVTGSGSALPPSSSLVSFPGAYTGSTPGIVFDVYQNTGATYPLPGPAVWSG